MGEGSETKRQLGRIVLRRKAAPLDELDAADAQEDRPTRPHAFEPDLRVLLMTLNDRHDVRSIDLRRVVIPLSVLAHVPREVARERQLLPLACDDERLLVAVADPSEQQALDELELSSGRRVFPCNALHGTLRDFIEAAYTAEASGASMYRGPLVSVPAGASRPPAGEVVALAGPGIEVALATEELSSPLGRPGELQETNRVTVPAPVGSSRRKVLLVDDSDDIRRLLARALGERGYEVVESASGLDALEKVRSCDPDILVMDAVLPEVHGFDLCRRIKASRRYGHVPIVMLSAVYRGWRFAEDLRRSYGVDEFLEKPFRIGDVLAAVERALAGPNAAPQAEEEATGPAAEQLRHGLEAYAGGDVEGAVEHLKRGLELNPLSFRLHYHLGLLYGKQENVFEAIQALESAADFRPRDFSTLKNLAVLYQRAGFRLKATELWERALTVAPDDDTCASIRNHLVSLL